MLFGNPLPPGGGDYLALARTSTLSQGIPIKSLPRHRPKGSRSSHYPRHLLTVPTGIRVARELGPGGCSLNATPQFVQQTAFCAKVAAGACKVHRHHGHTVCIAPSFNRNSYGMMRQAALACCIEQDEIFHIALNLDIAPLH